MRLQEVNHIPMARRAQFNALQEKKLKFISIRGLANLCQHQGRQTPVILVRIGTMMAEYIADVFDTSPALPRQI